MDLAQRVFAKGCKTQLRTGSLFSHFVMGRALHRKSAWSSIEFKIRSSQDYFGSNHSCTLFSSISFDYSKSWHGLDGALLFTRACLWSNLSKYTGLCKQQIFFKCCTGIICGDIGWCCRWCIFPLSDWKFYRQIRSARRHWTLVWLLSNDARFVYNLAQTGYQCRCKRQSTAFAKTRGRI